jgi:hypothetical protein
VTDEVPITKRTMAPVVTVLKMELTAEPRLENPNFFRQR